MDANLMTYKYKLTIHKIKKSKIFIKYIYKNQ